MRMTDVIAGLILLVASLPLGATPLVSPFDGMAVVPETARAKPCKTAPKPYTGDMMFASKYAGSGKSRDKLNPFAMYAYKRATADIEAFEKGIASSSDRYVRGQVDGATCTLDWMHRWAKADALAGEANAQGKAVRKWALSAIAFNYLKIVDAKSLDGGKRAAVQAWIGRLADRVVSDHAEIDPARMNNHHYWAAAAVAASAVVLDRPDLLAWSRDIYVRATDAIDADGVLATEMARGSRALEYHNYALAPLVMVAAVGQVNGMDLLGRRDCALCRLVTRVDAGLHDPDWFATRAGSRQEIDGEITGKEIPWVAPMAALCPGDARLAEMAARYAPFSARRLGGNLTEINSRISRERAHDSDNACRHLWR